MSMAVSMTAVRRFLIVPLAVAFILALPRPFADDAIIQAADRAGRGLAGQQCRSPSCYCFRGPAVAREPGCHAVFEGRNQHDEQDRGAACDVDGAVEPGSRHAS